MPKKILILSPEIFKASGGIQHMGRTLAYVLHQWGIKNNWQTELYVLNDQARTETAPYLPAASFKGFRRNKCWFTLNSIWKGLNANIILVHHVNLSFPAMVIRLLNPRCKIWLIAHGIEVWQPLNGWRKRIWKIADHFICVSNFTKAQLTQMQGVDSRQCTVLNNIADPFLKPPEDFRKPAHLLQRYGINHTDKVVLSVTRINAREKDKGYDQVITAIGKIKKYFPNIIYLLAGQWDKNEKERLEQLSENIGLGNKLILTGYIKAAELSDHYLLANLFVLPSRKEGFGIVFTEAMVHGLPVICGNKDGSIDALCGERLGTAVDPDEAEALELAIRKNLHHSLTREFRKHIQQESLKYFNMRNYTSILAKLIRDE